MRTITSLNRLEHKKSKDSNKSMQTSVIDYVLIIIGILVTVVPMILMVVSIL